jgi:hypothetical protein
VCSHPSFPSSDVGVHRRRGSAVPCDAVLESAVIPFRLSVPSLA